MFLMLTTWRMKASETRNEKEASETRNEKEASR